MTVTNHLARYFCAVILIVAAALKSYQLISWPSTGWIFGWLALAGFELFLSSWLLSGAFQTICRRVALATFAAFGCYVFYLSVTGAQSCGCFGQARISPWFTLSLDVIAVTLLWIWRPANSLSPQFRLVSAAALPLAICAVSLVLAVTFQLDATLADGADAGGSVVILEPETWVGRQFPLAEFIDIGDSLLAGSWTVLLYHHDCAKCLQAISDHTSPSKKIAPDESEPRLATIEFPPFAVSPFRGHSRVHAGKITQEKQWFVVTPTIVHIKDGRVIRVDSR